MKAKQVLLEHGLKQTAQRIQILDFFLNNEQIHNTAEDIYKAFLEKGEPMAIATIYRVLSVFESYGILRISIVNENKAIYEIDYDRKTHDHLICTSCGRVEEFVDPIIEQRQKEIAREHKFKLTGRTLNLYGLCEDCIIKEQQKNRM